MRKRVAMIVTITFLLGMSLSTQVGAEDEAPSLNTYSGNFWTRSTLTGDWWGSRNDLAAKGITFDMSLTQVGQGVVSGGKDEGWKYGGRGNLTINVDTQKLGLWPGGFLSVEVEGNFAKGDFTDSVNAKTGALMPVNSNQLYPTPTGDNLNVPMVAFMQFFSEYAGVILGKLDTTSGDANEFAHGKGDDQFLNLAFNFNPVAVLTCPNSTLGAGVIVLPTKDPKAATVSFSVLQTNGQASRIGFSDLHSNQLTFVGEGRVKTNFFGLTGHQLIAGGYSNSEFTSLGQNLRFILPASASTLEKQDGSWMIYYNFDQYLYEPSKGSGQGLGIFGRFGVSDGNPNPMHFFYSIGVGGKGIIPGRPLDRYGIGFYYIDVGNPKLRTILGTRSFLRDEYGFEAFYNFAITPWMQLTPDIQVIRPAQKEVITRTGPITFDTRNVHTATVLGLRLKLVF